VSDLVRVVSLAEIPENSNRAFDVGGVSVLIARTAAGVFAVENRCSHAYQTLEGGRMKAVHISCPLHGVRFDMRNGCPSGDLTDKPIRTWPVSIVDGEILLDMSAP